MCFLVSPPTVTIYPNNVTAKILGSVTFICYTTGFGDFSFVWEHDSSVISASNSTLQQDSLSIDPVLPQHQGQYRCTVTASYTNLSTNSDAFTMLNLNGNFLLSYDIIYITLHIVFLAPSFDSPTVLHQISSSASTNTITVTIPQIDDSGGPIRYSVCNIPVIMYYNVLVTVIITLW